MLVPLRGTSRHHFVCCRRRRRPESPPPPPPPPPLLRLPSSGSAEGMFRVHVADVYASWFVLRFVNGQHRFSCRLRAVSPSTNYRLFIVPDQAAWVENPTWDVDPVGNVTLLTVTLYSKDDMLRSVNEHVNARATATLATAFSVSLSSSCAIQ